MGFYEALAGDSKIFRCRGNFAGFDCSVNVHPTMPSPDDLVLCGDVLNACAVLLCLGEAFFFFPLFLATLCDCPVNCHV